MKLGENGRGLLSRWYPHTLQRRILRIADKKHAITFRQGDGIAYMRQLSRDPDAVFFIDPPYTIAGRRLYSHSEIDHEELFKIAAKLKGDFLMTYDEADPIKELARKFGLETHTVFMKNTHNRVMRELLIGRDLRWAKSRPPESRQDSLFELGLGEGLRSY